MMTLYLHHVTMNNGDMFDLYYLDKILDWKKLSEERWLPYEVGETIRYINIAQISDIYVKPVEPVEKVRK